MNLRYIYIGSVVVLSYVLFLSWNAEKEIKQEFEEASLIKQNKSEELCQPVRRLALFKSKTKSLMFWLALPQERSGRLGLKNTHI